METRGSREMMLAESETWKTGSGKNREYELLEK